MGCCFSRDLLGFPYSGNAGQGQHGESSRAINSTVAPTDPSALHSSLSRSDSEPSVRRPARSSRRRQHPSIPLGEHYNQPIRRHEWRSKRRIWSSAMIAREREDFFDTRVTGKPEVWAALKLTVSLMRAGDIATAQGIIDAAGVTVPTGDLCDGCYDQNGVLYRLPQVIVSDPSNIVDTVAGVHDSCEAGEAEDGDGKLGMTLESDEELEEDIESKREEKGKMSGRDSIKVYARLSDRGGPDLQIGMEKSQHVGLLVRKIRSAAKLTNEYRLRVAYLGKILKENETLFAQGWKEGHVVNALVLHHS